MDDKLTTEPSRGKKLLGGAIAAPLLLTSIPAITTFLMLILIGGGPPVKAVILALGVAATVIGLLIGLITGAFLLHKRSTWSAAMRERLAASGIKAEQIGWFKHELKSNEKRALKAVEARDLLLADAFRETLASRLTATRIIKSSKRELMLARRRQNSVRQLKSSKAEEFQAQIKQDIEKIAAINDEANLMQAEAESRLQMIEAAASRHGSLADSELALKKLSLRTAELPLALEAAKMSEEIRLELEREDLE